MSTLDHPSVAKEKLYDPEADQDAAAQGIRILPADARTAELAAAALGVEVGAIANSLLFDADAPHGPEVMHQLPIRYLSIITYPQAR